MTDVQDRLSAALAGRYVIERELGRGGMATVYLAQDLKHDRPVALKVMNPDLGLGAGPERFLREVRTTARLDHPHILAVHDSGEAAGLLWYTMPYVEGESLRQRLERGGPLPVEEAVRLAREAADALDCAHRAGVVHRDVKPENILLSRNHARVADFGIAHALEAATGSGERITATGVSVGTPAYMSPEQAAGARALDGRSDIYSLGCVLYEMLSGEPPFTGPTPQAVIAKRFVESPLPVRRARPAVPPAVEAALERALAREPADRFQTTAQFRDALGQPLVQPLAQAPAALVRRRRGLLPVVVLLLSGLGLGIWRQDYRPRPAGSDGATGDTATGDTATGPAAGGARRLAVLPFEYLGDSSEAHLADGITDEVRGKLAALSGLEVIAGASSGEYRHTPKPLRQVARELGVRYLLVGKVSREGGRGEEGRLRVSPELVDVGPHGAPTTKWQEPAEAPLTAVFQVQADLARGVAEALGVALGAEERLRLARPPTENLAAYKAYLRGEALYTTGSTNPSVTRQAIPYYEQAVALDSGFVEAWYRLAGAHSRIYGAGGTASRAEAEAARGAAERALALAPDRPEGRVALGYYYINVSADNRRGLEQFILALRLSPNFPDALILAGLAEQGLGRWDPALEHFRRAAALDPRSIDAASALTVTLLWRRRHTEALAAADRALALAPAAPSLIEIRAMVSLARGDLNGARMVVRRALERGDPSTLVAWFGWSFDLYWVLERAEQELLLRLPPNAYDNNRASWGLILTQTYHLRGDAERTRAYADSARLALEEQLRGAPQDAQLHALHGLALAHLGRRAEAVREGERGVALAPLTEQAINGGYVRHLLVRIHLLVGEQDQALSLLEELLKIPHYLSPGWLRVDPNFQPLRGRQRFEHLTNG